MPGFNLYKPVFEELYEKDFTTISEVNHAFIKAICDILNIKTEIRWSHEFELGEGKTERLISICEQLGATDYYTGSAAKAYMDEKLFFDKNIHVHYYDYSGYPEYEQRFPPFEHGVSILDLLFSTGKEAPSFMKTFNNE